jgi:hypothetical protein
VRPGRPPAPIVENIPAELKCSWRWLPWRGDGALLVESKDDMRKRGIPSPDDGDAFCLTFARSVAPPRVPIRTPRPSTSQWV